LMQHLDRLGITSPRGWQSWSASALRGLLSNPAYLGQVYANWLRTRPAERRRSALLPQGRGDSSKRVADPAEWIAVAAIPAIVTAEQFERARERLAYNQRMARRNNRVHQYLLQYLLRLLPPGLHGASYFARSRLLPLPDQDADAPHGA
jgi:site-specific DNA recombinase